MPISTAIVVAAGEGRRLRPLTRYRPKPMLPAANRPLLEYVLDSLIEAGIDEIHVVVGYRRDRVAEHFGSAYRGVPLDYHTQSRQLGSGHALLQAREAVDGAFVAVNGDQIVDPGMVRDVLEAHGDAIATLGVTESERAAYYGVVELDGTRVTDLVERPAEAGEGGVDGGGLLNAGVYAFMPDVFRAIEEAPTVDGERGLPQALARLVEAGELVRGVRTAGTWIDATYPWDLLTVTRELLSTGRVDEAEREPDVFVAETARVDETARLRPPVVVGTDAVVGPGAVVGPNVALGRGVRVGASAVVDGAVLDADTRVGPNATLVDCVTGESVAVGPGAVVPGGPGDVRVETTVHEGTELGGLLADRAELAGAGALAPGAMLGPEARVDAGALAKGTVPEDATVTR
jgi:glucose-1-phosphate thymidylyltransferase